MPAPYVTLYYLGTQYHAPADAVERAGLVPWQHIDGEDMKRLKGVLPAQKADDQFDLMDAVWLVLLVIPLAIVGGVAVWLVLL